ncbi:MAG: hypothetical protein HRT57_09770 [Crocinitomicaceae bacterium]|nr:hypothetical protein [Crocinitomicaceae bacterium]
MKRYLLLLFALFFCSIINAQIIEPDKDTLSFAPMNQIVVTSGMSGYKVNLMVTYKRAHLKSSIGTFAGVNMGYWYYGLVHSKNFDEPSPSDFQMISSYDSITVFRQYSELEKYYGFQFGRSREIRSCDRSTFSGFQFTYDYFVFANYGQRSIRYADEYLMYETPATPDYFDANGIPQVPERGDRTVTSINAGIGGALGLDMVFRMSDGSKNNRRNFILGLRFAVPNIGVDIPFGSKTNLDPLDVFTETNDRVSLTFNHQFLLKFGVAF